MIDQSEVCLLWDSGVHQVRDLEGAVGRERVIEIKTDRTSYDGLVSNFSFETFSGVNSRDTGVRHVQTDQKP